MQVISKYILVTEVTKKGESSVGLLDTDSEISSERYQEAIIDEVGHLVDVNIKAGDRILYDRAQGYNVTIDNKVYRVILERDVAVIL
jgi:co-chaperonin GroES (HSP10)